MKKTFMLLGAGLCFTMQTTAQKLDTLTELEAGTNIVDLAVSGGKIFATAGKKVYSSSDASSWSPTADVPDFVINEERPRHMHAASDGSLYVAVTGYVGGASWGGGIMKTTDNGATWKTFTEFDMLAHEETGRIIELSGGRILTYSSVGDNNYHATLSGSAFTRSKTDLMLYEATKYGDTLVASTTSGRQYSLDMGDTWNTLTLTGSSTIAAFGSAVFHNTSKYRFGGAWAKLARAAAGTLAFTDLTPSLASETPSFYPKQIISDGKEQLFMTYTDAAGNCYLEKSGDNGDNWTLMCKIKSTACFTKVVVFGDDIVGAIGSRIVRVANVAEPFPATLTVNRSVSANKMQLSPNPAGNFLYINNFSGAVKIYNVSGVCCKEVTVKAAETLDISDLGSGLYLVAGMDKEGVMQQQKFVKQ